MAPQDFLKSWLQMQHVQLKVQQQWAQNGALGYVTSDEWDENECNSATVVDTSCQIRRLQRRVVHYSRRMALVQCRSIKNALL